MSNNTPHEKGNEIHSLAEQAKQSLQKKTSELQTSLEQKAQELIPQMDNILKTLQTKQNDHQTALEQKAEEINQIMTTIKSTQTKAHELQESIKATLGHANQDQQTISHITGEIKKVKADVDTQLKNATSAQQQCQEQTNTSSKHAAETKAKLESATELLASIEEQKSNILEFYKEIENHRAKMLDIEKDAIGKFNQLKDRTDTHVGDFKEKTENIITENEELQQKVNKLLVGATSGALFRVFHDRKDFLLRGRNFWKWAVGVTSTLVAIAVITMAWFLGDKPDIIFFVRLAVAAPLLFLMYFSAAQYKRERQAEEEYAFKSAISLSLEPYRKLLEQMRKEKATETDFVKGLITEVFDNPVKRLFKARKPGEEPPSESTPGEAIYDAIENLPEEGFTKETVIGAIKSVLRSLGTKHTR